MGEDEDDISKLEEQFHACRFDSAKEMTQLRSDVGMIKDRLDKIEAVLYGPSGLVASISLMVEHFTRLDKAINRAIDILIPPDGSAGLLARLEAIEEIIDEVSDTKKWFSRTVAAAVITMIISILVAVLK